MAKKLNFQNPSKSRSTKSNIRNYVLLPLAIAAGVVIGEYVLKNGGSTTINYFNNKTIIEKTVTKHAPVNNYSLDGITAKEFLAGSKMVFVPGVKKDTVFLKYRPANLKSGPYDTKDTLTFSPHISSYWKNKFDLLKNKYHTLQKSQLNKANTANKNHQPQVRQNCGLKYGGK